jgi:hypothetical protein
MRTYKEKSHEVRSLLANFLAITLENYLKKLYLIEKLTMTLIYDIMILLILCLYLIYAWRYYVLEIQINIK